MAESHRWSTRGDAHRRPLAGRNCCSADGSAECRAEHARLFREHSWFRRLAGIPSGPEGGPDPAAVDRAVTAVRVLVRIELERVITGLDRRLVQDPAASEPDIILPSREEV